MGKKVGAMVEEFLQRQALRRWTRTAEAIDGFDLAALRSFRGPARAMKRQIDRVLHVAEGRLPLPMVGSMAMSKPASADSVWRSEPWRGPLPAPASVETRTEVGTGVTVFHDRKVSELTVRQVRNQRESDLAPFGLRMDLFRIDGSFLSPAIELPPESVEGLRLKHLIRRDVIAETQKPLEIFARVNVKHGPNVEQVVRELPLSEAEVMVEFHPAYTRMNERRVEGIWVDLIFEGPEVNQMTLRDLTFCRRPRAEL